MRLKTGFAVLVLSACPNLLLAGDLNPPPGPVTPTMVALDSIEPRLCLNDVPGAQGFVAQVTQAGHYFLNADLIIPPGMSGVNIATIGHTAIDLNGFSIIGEVGSANGIVMSTPPNTGSSLRVCNCSYGPGGGGGRIAQFTGDGIQTGGVEDVTIENVLVEGCGNGVACGDTRHFLALNVTARGNAIDGFNVRQEFGPVQTSTRCISSTSSGNGNNGFALAFAADGFSFNGDGCSSEGNGGHGLALEVFDTPGAGGQNRVRVNRWECARNGGAGIDISLPTSNDTAIVIESTMCSGNLGDGTAVRGALAGGRHRGHVTILKASEMISNGGGGASSDNPLHAEGCTFSENTLHGASVNGPDADTPMLLMNDCAVTNNGGIGAQVIQGSMRANRTCFNGSEQGVDCGGPCVLNDSSAGGNFLSGVYVRGPLHATSCSFESNASNGVRVDGGPAVLQDTVCFQNGNNPSGATGAYFVDCANVTLTRCAFSTNHGPGVETESATGIGTSLTMSECVANGNTDEGFDIDDATSGVLGRCATSGNGLTGFHLGSGTTQCVVRGCTSTGDGISGFSVLGSGNLIVGNRSSGGLFGFGISGGNTSGPILVGLNQIAQNGNPDANVAY